MTHGATIAACSTGETAYAGRALIRLSGPDCERVQRLLFFRRACARSPQAAMLRLTDTHHLPCLAWLVQGPRTFTGEDTLEMLLPGSPHIVQRVMARLCSVEGVRPAGPGEFSARAYLAGKLSVDQAEGIGALIGAQSNAQLRAAAEVINGGSGARYRRWAATVTDLLALVEAGIDFTDQDDVVAISPERLGRELDGLRTEIVEHLGCSRGRESVHDVTTVALVGPPNAGKSTLFNALLERTRAVVAPVAGTTRDVLSEPLLLRGESRSDVLVDLLDLPGLDAGATGIDALAQSAAREALAKANVLLLCAAHPPWPAVEAGGPFTTLKVHTKADRPEGRMSDAQVHVCALTGEGLAALKRLIAEAAGAAPLVGGGVAVARHGRLLRASLDALTCIDHTGPAELAAYHLRAALDALGEIVGAIPPDEVIGRIFASFCVGK